MKKGLKNESCERVNGFQVLCTCKTMLALPGTRQMMINQAFKQWGINKKPCCPKIAAVWKYIISTTNDINSCKSNHPKSSTRCWK
jgi:hypothetical protein